MRAYKVAVIGGGASGLCAAIQAACTGYGPVAVFERLPRAGKKLLTTGNGRCNLSHENAVEHPYHNAAFAKHTLNKYDVDATRAFFRRLGILTITDAEGRLYPMSNTAASVLDALRFECVKRGVDILCEHRVTSLRKNSERFEIACADDRFFTAQAVILATGGKAAPVHGSDGSGFRLLTQLGHSVTPVFPALVQLRTDETYPRQLKGLRAAANITVCINSKPVAEASGEVQFTEYGLSGIASMEVSRAVSAHFAKGDTDDCYAQLDLVPSLSLPELENFLVDTAAEHPDLEIGKLLFGLLPGRLSMMICKASGLYSFSKTAATLTGDNLRAVADCAKRFRLDIKGVQGFENAQVTAGGADVSEFNPLTLQSCKVINLYCCGELLDVDGGCGGFNLQWAWSSGLLAGELGNYKHDGTEEQLYV